MATTNIYIFSRQIRTGKTTELKEWIESNKNVAGILTPDVDGRRKLLDIKTGAYHYLELNETIDNTIAVGRFYFDKNVFEKAQQILLSALQLRPEWLVIDEIGKLEIEQALGLEPAVGRIINEYKHPAKNLLLVIRDSLLSKAIDHYKLENAVVVNHLNSLP